MNPNPPENNENRADDDAFFDLTPEGDEPTLDDDGGADEAEVSRELAEARAAAADLNEKLLRTLADYQNYARRSAREVEHARAQQTVKVGRALVTALDHLDRALDADPATVSAADLHKGLTSIREEFHKALASVGLQRVVVEPGEEFDPNRHEALMHVPHDEIESHHVIATLMPGYFVEDTPVRPVQVSVAQ